MRTLGIVALCALVSCEPTRRSDRPRSDADTPPVLGPLGSVADNGGAQRPTTTNDDDAMRVHFVDIGQGLSVLVELPCGAVLFDTGGELNEQFDATKALRTYLDAFFARRTDLKSTLDLLVLSHPHIDHTRSTQQVLERYTVRNVVDNGTHIDDIGAEPQEAMYAWLQSQGGTVGHMGVTAETVDPQKGLQNRVVDPVGTCPRSSTDPAIRVLWGQVTTELDSYGDNPNEHSVVVRVDHGKSSALLLGDLQKLGISRLSRRFADAPHMLDADILQVAHHGSHNATSAHELKMVTPKLAVISMGPYERDLDWTARRYGHPHIKALTHLTDAEYGVSWFREPAVEAWVGLRGAWEETPSEFEKRTIAKAVYATGWDGNVVITANANGWLDVQAGAPAGG